MSREFKYILQRMSAQKCVIEIDVNEKNNNLLYCVCNLIYTIHFVFFNLYNILDIYFTIFPYIIYIFKI